MAGHSKWANIKHKKERVDAKKGKVFSRVTKEIISAVKQGGSDPKANHKLRIAIQKAKAVNLPADNIERNIKKASSVDGQDYLELVYEIYGHGGVAIVAFGMTDNKNRAAAEIRLVLNKKGGNIAAPGAVLFNFDRKGVIQIGTEQLSEEELFEKISWAGAEDFALEEENYLVLTSPETLYDVKEKLESKGLSIKEASVELLPKVMVPCDRETAEVNQELLDHLENLDDIDEIFHNMDVA